MERCPQCESQFIQYNNVTGELYCLEKDCNHRWQQKLNYDKIKNDYLRTSIHNNQIPKINKTQT